MNLPFEVFPTLDAERIRDANGVRVAVVSPRDDAREICQFIVTACNAHDQLVAENAALREQLALLSGHSPAANAGDQPVVDMVLHCPSCRLQHIDAPDDRTAEWENPPHRSHLCHDCGHIWRPADIPTNGVKVIKTKGKADSPIAVGAVELLESARYRWLRDKSEPGICAFYLSVGKAFDGVKFTRETVDEAIDAQIAAGQEGGVTP